MPPSVPHLPTAWLVLLRGPCGERGRAQRDPALSTPAPPSRCRPGRGHRLGAPGISCRASTGSESPPTSAPPSLVLPEPAQICFSPPPSNATHGQPTPGCCGADRAPRHATLQQSSSESGPPRPLCTGSGCCPHPREPVQGVLRLLCCGSPARRREGVPVWEAEPAELGGGGGRRRGVLPSSCIQKSPLACGRSHCSTPGRRGHLCAGPGPRNTRKVLLGGAGGPT